jgi:archaellum component FlaC
MAGKKDSKGDSIDYLDLLNSWIPNGWFQVSRATGFRIQERLRREVGSVITKYKNAKGSKKKRELDDKVYSLTILVNELMSIKDIVDKAEHASQLVEEWRRKYSQLEEEKDSLAQEMVPALSRKDQELESLNKELSDYIEKVTNLEKLSCVS